MSLRKDKEKVLGEIFDEARIKTFLEYLSLIHILTLPTTPYV